MPEDPKPGSLLDSLRAKSSAVRAQGEAAKRPVEEALAEMDRRLWRAFRWLDEALGHLEVIQPVVAHRFTIPNVVAVERPQFQRGFVSYRRKALGGQELLEQVEVFYRLVGGEPIVLRVHPGSATGVEERLRVSSMPYQYQTEQDEKRVVKFGVFHITPTVTANIRFEPDYHHQTVEVILRNVDRFESVALDFAPDKLDEAALEDLLKFMLGEPNGFLRRAPLAGFRARRDAVNGKQVAVRAG
ncbi:MAG TPA: hypothetical protein VGI14_20280 [Casimicrobiaceae bacterium]|jgi:hypothetical protein